MKKNNEINNKIKKDLINYCLPIMFVFLLNLFFIGINYKFWIPLLETKGIIIETIIIYTTSILIFGISGKWRTTITILGIFILTLSIINQIKYSFTAEPVVLSDILFLSDTGELMQIVQGELWKTIKLFIIPVIIEIIIFCIFIKIGRDTSKESKIAKAKTRIILISVSLIVLLILFLPIQLLNKFMKSKVFDIENRNDYAGFTSISQYYLTYGIIGGIYGEMLENRLIEPDNYNEDIINKALLNVKENENKTLGKPNIIVVFSESFWDIDQLDEVEFNTKVTPNFNDLKNKGLFFNMITPSYGGISSNVEYEFLTGSNTMFFNHSYIPYMQLYRNGTYYNRPSIIMELKNNGYKTKIATCASPELFNCGRFYKYLQVDEVEYITNVEEKNIKGKYVSDEYITDKIIDKLNNKDKNEKMFYMTMTMQAHMPYPKDKYSSYDVWVIKSNFSNEVNDTLTSYAQGIYDADKQLGRLYEYIQKLDEPTIIVFYGDHLPYLYSGRVNAIDILKYFNTSNKTLNTYRKYNTQSLIIANFGLDTDKEKTKYLGPDLLSAYILNNMDINISNYYKWLYESRKDIGSANFLVTVDNNGNLYNTYELSGKQKNIYELRKNIEYKLFVK